MAFGVAICVARSLLVTFEMMDANQLYRKYRAYRNKESKMDAVARADRWEYRRLDVPSQEVALPEFEKRLNTLGEDGWELTMGLHQHGFPERIYLVLKRHRAR
jgi:uncharacterized protein YPO0396